MVDDVRHLDSIRARLDREAEAEAEVPPVDAYAQDDRGNAGFLNTDLANARRLAQRHGANIKFTSSANFLTWDGQRWVHDPSSVFVQALAKQCAEGIFDEIKTAANRREMFQHAQRSQSKVAIEAMIFLARSEPGIPAAITDFDSDGMLLNLANGTLDLRSGDLRAHRREDLITKLVPIAYHSDADCELWDAFLWRVTDRNEELYGYLRRLVGYLLTGLTTEQVLHFLYGSGANGKTVFCEIVAELLGDYAVVCPQDLVMLKRYGGIPNDVARLRGARVALMNETTQGSRFDESKLKDLTGGDKLTARFLHQEFFDFKPAHKLIIRGNHKPAIDGTDEGIWRRLRLIPFMVQIAPEEQDKQLLEKLRAELPGILRWAVQGCLEWQRVGLNPPAVITEAVRRYRNESDTLGRFIAECCEVSKLAQVRSSVLYRHYVQYAEQAGERWIPAKDLPHEMEYRGFTYKRGTGGQRLYLGITLVQSEASWQPE